MVKDFKDDQQNQDRKPQKERRKLGFGDGLDITVIILVMFLFVAIIFAFLAEFVFDAGIDWKGVGLDTGIVAACTIAIYLLLRSFAQRRGRKTQRWKEARESLNVKGKEILEKNYAQYIPKYCRAWEQRHIDDERNIILGPVGITLKEYKEKYCSLSEAELLERYPELTEYQMKALVKTHRLKTVRYDEGYLFVSRERHFRRSSPSGGLTSKTVNILDNLRIAATTIITSLFSASILQEVIFNPSKETVIKLVVKLAVIITFAAMGMAGGYNFTVTKEVNEMNAKSDEMDTFMKWCADGKFEEADTVKEDKKAETKREWELLKAEEIESTENITTE